MLKTRGVVNLKEDDRWWIAAEFLGGRATILMLCFYSTFDIKKILNANGDNVAVWTVPAVAHSSCKLIHLRMRLSAAQSLLN